MNLRHKISAHATASTVLLSSFALGFLFGNGLHLHDAFSHEHGQAKKHSHGWTIHAHVKELGNSSVAVKSDEDGHEHAVPILESIAIITSSLSVTITAVPQRADFAGLAKLSQPILNVTRRPRALHETSPPPDDGFALHINGRSPPLS